MRPVPTAFVLVISTLALAACSASSSPTPSAPPTTPAPAATGAETPAPAPTASEAAEGVQPGDRLPSFTVSGVEAGKEVSFDAATAEGVSVYCVTSVTCPTTKVYAERLREIEGEYAPKGARFVWVYSNRTESDEDKAENLAERGLSGTLSYDHGAAIAKVLEAQHTPEMVVVRDGLVVYRGAIDDGKGSPKKAKNQTLAAAIGAALEGRAPDVSHVEPVG